MQKLVFRNANGIELDFTTDPFGITEWEGFSADELNIQSQQVPFQDGGVFLDALLGQRELSIIVAMNDKNNLETRYRLRREMISALNPKLGEGVLIYTNDYLSKQIHCIPQLPVFQNKNSNDSGTPKVSCSFTACNPYWEDLEDTNINIEKGIIEIENNGDIPADFEMNLIAEDNIRIENTTENKVIEVQNNETGIINISTKTGEKGVNKINCNILEQRISTLNKKVAYSPTQNIYLFGNSKYYKEGKLYNIQYSGTPYYIDELDYFFLLMYDGEYKILKSRNAEDWETVYTGNTQLNALHYSPDFEKIYVVGNSGVILSSSDGSTFSALTSGTSNNLYCVSNLIFYSDDQQGIAIGGESNTILQSTDGTTFWNFGTSGIENTFDIYSINTNDSRNYQIISGTGGNIYLTSHDYWSKAEIDTTAKIYDIYFYNGLFYGLEANGGKIVKGFNSFEIDTRVYYWNEISYSKALNTLLLSSYGLYYLDGDEYKTIGIDYPSAKRIKYIKERNKLLILNSNSIAIANKDFSEYEVVFESEDNIEFIDAVWNNEKIIAIGRYLYESGDLRNWSKIDTGSYSSFANGVWAERYNSFYFCSGNYGCYKYQNGVFSQVLSNGTTVAYAEDKNILVVLASFGDSFYSEDGGATFETINLLGGATHFIASCYSDEKGMFVAGGHDPSFFYSYDGKNWLCGNHILGEVHQCEWLSDMQVFLVMERGYLYITPDGVSVINTNIYMGDSYEGYFEIVDDFIYCPVNGFLILQFQLGENLISQLSANSDIGMKLKNGKNKLIITGIKSISGSLSFRQKYLGV